MAVQNAQALLKKLLEQKEENSWLEFKTNNDDPELIGQWIAASANAAILGDQSRAYLVYGIEDKTRRLIGTTVRLDGKKCGGENFINWVSRLISPSLMLEFLDFEYQGKMFSIIVVEPTYDRPVQFSGSEFIRVGENIKKLKDFPEHERSIWMATARRKFENAIALPHQSQEQIVAKLDVDSYYKLVNEEKPERINEIIKRFLLEGFIVDDMEGAYDITNLSAILLARDVQNFPSISNKSIRVIKYVGVDKRESSGEIEGGKGYAVGFSGLLKYVLNAVPREEKYIDGIRTMVPIYPEIAIREIIANSLIHQDFTIFGIGPVVEIYSDRIEVINPGNCLIEKDRIIDERRSRNEKLASCMRSLGLCEERGGGLDKALIEIEERKLPAFDFYSSENSTRVILFGPKKFNKLSKAEKQLACFYHCILRYQMRDYMNNTTLRDRFSLPSEEYQAVSTIITEAVRKKRIIPADASQGKRNSKYVPYWAR